MNGGVETELKLKVLGPAGGAEAWATFTRLDINENLAADWVRTEMEAWYYDTANQSLQQAGIAYRVRREGDCWVATVKANGSSDGGLHQRQEWNVTNPDKEPRPELFLELPIGQTLLDTIGDQKLEPLFATVFERNSAHIKYEDSFIELAFDIGSIIAGDRTEPICELELELKSGCSTALLRLGAAFAQQMPLAPEHRSKFYRALILAGLAKEQSKQGGGLQENTSLTEALPVLFMTAISKVFAAYIDFAENSHEPKTIRRLRVKLRRLRSILQFAKPCLAETEFLSWKEQLTQLSGAVAPLRDIDVVSDQWKQLCDSPFIAFDSRPWLGENITKRRAMLQDKATQQLDKLNLPAKLLRFWAWIASQPWQQGDYPITLGTYGRWRIGGWLAALLEAGKAADWHNDEELHSLRLRLKRIRYALAVMPFRGGRTDKLLLQIKGLQALLGAINDGQASAKELLTLSRGATRAVYRDIGMLSGWQGKVQEITRSQLRPQWKAFRQSSRRWLEN